MHRSIKGEIEQHYRKERKRGDACLHVFALSNRALCHLQQRRIILLHLAPGIGPPAIGPIPWRTLVSSGYFCWTSSCVRVASAYDNALTISPSVLDSSAARSK